MAYLLENKTGGNMGRYHFGGNINKGKGRENGENGERKRKKTKDYGEN